MNYDGIDISKLMFQPFWSNLLFGLLLAEIFVLTVMVLRKRCPHEIKVAFLTLFTVTAVTDTINLLAGTMMFIDIVFQLVAFGIVFVSMIKIRRLYATPRDALSTC